jgi:hypothetical protein
MINTPEAILAKLNELVGQEVEVAAGDDCEDGNGIHIRLHGKLEKPEDGMNRWYVRVRDGSSGAEGISFHVCQVDECHKQVYNWQIFLKQRLNAPTL